MKTVVDTYNDNSNRGLKYKTPNEVYDSHDNQLARHLTDMVHNQNIYKSVPFKPDDKVRILEEKGKFDKGKRTFSKDVYTVNKKDGYKILLDGTSRKLKPGELLKVNSVSNPISDKYLWPETLSQTPWLINKSAGGPQFTFKRRKQTEIRKHAKS